MSSERFIELYSLRRSRALWGAGILCLLLLLERIAAVQRLSSHVLGGIAGDAGLYLWLTQAFATGSLFDPWFHTPAFYPYGGSLAFSDNFLLPSLATRILNTVFFSHALAYNLMLLIAQFLNGYVTFRLCYSLTRSFIPALLSGAAFMSFGFLTTHLGHPQLQFAFFIPLGIWLFFQYLHYRHFLVAAAIGCSVSAAFLCSVYMAIFTAFAVSMVGLGCLLLQPKFFIFRRVVRMLSGIALGLLPVIPFIPPYLEVKEVFGERQLYEAYYFSATLLSYFSTDEHNVLFGSLLCFSDAERQLFCGFSIFALAILALRAPLQRKFPIRELLIVSTILLLGLLLAATPYPWRISGGIMLWMGLILSAAGLARFGKLLRSQDTYYLSSSALVMVFVFVALCATLVSLGPLGNPTKGQFLSGPHILFYYLYPGFDGLRAISRIGVVTQLALCILAGLGLTKLLNDRSLALFGSIPIAAFACFEHLHAHFPLDPYPETPPVYEELSRLPATSGTMITLPLTTSLDKDSSPASWTDFATRATEAMLFSLQAGYETINGYSGIRTKTMRDLPALLARFPDQGSLDELARYVGLRYIVYNTSGLSTSQIDSLVASIGAHADRLKLLNSDTKGQLLLQFNPQRLVENSFSLLAPPSSQGEVVLETEWLGEPSQFPATLRAVLSSEKGEPELFQGEVKTIGTYTLHIPIPREKISSSIRPLIINLLPSKPGVLKVRRSLIKLPE